MRRKAAALLACLCLLPGCAAQQASPADDAESFGLWFVSADGSSESAVMQETREWSAQPDAQALMGALLRGPEEEMLSSPFPAGVSLRAITYGTDGVLQVDLSEQYGGLTGIDLTLADCCIALTLCQLPGVEAVRITVEGEEIPYRSWGLLMCCCPDWPRRRRDFSPCCAFHAGMAQGWRWSTARWSGAAGRRPRRPSWWSSCCLVPAGRRGCSSCPRGHGYGT